MKKDTPTKPLFTKPNELPRNLLSYIYLFTVSLCVHTRHRMSMMIRAQSVGISSLFPLSGFQSSNSGLSV